MECGGGLLHLVLLVSLTTIFSLGPLQAYGKAYSVNNYDAVPDGKTDNSKAFLEAWAEACQSETAAQVVVPDGVYKLSSTVFKGPCKAPINFLVAGTIQAFPSAKSEESWVSFQYVDNLLLSGNGVFDGQGSSAWPAKESHSSLTLPFSIGFDFVTKSMVTGITSKDSKGPHINVFSCTTLRIDGVHITAPGDSPNTDGIRISRSTSVWINKANIATGDDCISMLSGNHNITITDTVCGPGHGISIGSLGKYSTETDFSGLHVSNCSLFGTTNGLRIKTFAPSASQITVSSVLFENIQMRHVQNPIIIDQNYSPDHNSEKGSSSVKIEDVTFRNIWGISESEDAVKLSCSPSNPCTEIKLEDIKLTYAGDVLATSSCENAGGVAVGVQLPSSCIS